MTDTLTEAEIDYDDVDLLRYLLHAKVVSADWHLKTRLFCDGNSSCFTYWNDCVRGYT